MGKVAEIIGGVTETVKNADVMKVGSIAAAGLLLIGGIVITISGMKKDDDIVDVTDAQTEEVTDPDNVVEVEAVPVEEEKTE